MVAKTKKSTKSENLTIRLDPQTRFLADMAARVQKRSLSSFVEWAVQESFKSVTWNSLRLKDKVSIEDLIGSVWDIDDSERFVKLAFHHPELLNYSEDLMYNAITQTYPNLFFKNLGDEFFYTNIHRKNLREHWELLKKAIWDDDGEAKEKLEELDFYASVEKYERENYHELMEDLVKLKNEKGIEAVFDEIKEIVNLWELERHPL